MPADHTFSEQSDYYALVTVGIVFMVVNTLATIARAVSRRMRSKNFTASDWLMPVSLLFNIGICICLLLAAKWGTGPPVLTVPTADFIHYTYLTCYAIPVLYVFAVTFSKLAVVDLYLQVFINRYARISIWITGAILSASCIANFITIMAQCHPFASAALYNPLADGWCHDLQAHFTWGSLPNIVTDVVLFALPIPLVVKLQQPWRVKLGIFFTFLVGSLGAITAVIRLYQFYTYSADTLNADLSQVAHVIIIWTCVEPGVYHLAACLITLKPLLTWFANDSPFSTMFSQVTLLTKRSNNSTDNSTNHKRNTFGSSRRPSKQKSITSSDHDDEFIATSGEVYKLDSHSSVQSQNGSSNPAHGNGIRVDREFRVA